ncbi:citrate/2-methylcitrate synthase [Prauserella cavernicola]|uniref:citrate synthase (unknown stereospecificity) n=1 Tax=Prauserella cavernicola TaxID=2800127 RepID=A0A934V8F1_9PSEU|nr:citrate/2-methylcitrate synthase [Prauserella cavernicola]MBK1787693.1 helix-turn-helix domain-containing protein [Prauserella cavernicola]
MAEQTAEADGELLTADEAADLLGVRRQTVYAYVSRGQLTRDSKPGSRQSWFRRTDVEAMARGDRAQQAGRKAPTNRTEVTSIVDDQLLYRGRDAVELARTATFEQAVEWLWRGAEDDVPAWRELADLPAEVAALPLPAQCLPLDRLKLATAGIATVDGLRYDLSTPAVLAVARSLLAALVRSLPPRGETGDPGSLAAQLWPRLTAAPARPRGVRLLDQALVLVADHGLAPSTRAVRLAASVDADPYSVVLTGMSVASGLRHGGSSIAVHGLLDDIGEPGQVAAVVAEHLRRGGPLPGFGQPRYVRADPRAAFLLGELLADSTVDPNRLRVVREVIELVENRSDEHPNVEFALGALCFAHDMVRGAGEAVFVLGRVAGWIAHALEEHTGRH